MIEEQRPVGQIGQRVMGRLVQQPRLSLLPQLKEVGQSDVPGPNWYQQQNEKWASGRGQVGHHDAQAHLSQVGHDLQGTCAKE
jgi:hypothetical protein